LRRQEARARKLSADAARRRSRDLRRHGLLRRLTGFQPATPVASGVDRFVAWYRDYYRILIPVQFRQRRGIPQRDDPGVSGR
jgi:nucleoside-diphosphate-sugar epimerase